MLIRAWAQSVITAGDLQGFVLVEHEKMDNCVLDIRDSRISAPTFDEVWMAIRVGGTRSPALDI